MKLLIDTPLVKRAFTIIMLGHADDFRDDKVTPYIVHLLEVGRIALELKGDKIPPRMREILYTVALLHDLAEDHKKDGYTVAHIIKLLGDLITEHEADMIFDVLTLLDKTTHKDYLTYILSIKFEDAFYSTRVKIADISHNIIDVKGSRRDKYLLALHILEAD